MATEKQDALARKILNTFAKKRTALVFFGLLGLALLVIGLRMIILDTTPLGMPDPAKVVNYDTAQPGESKPSNDDYSAYTVGAKEPRTISIPSLKLFGLVQKVGLNKENAIAVPTNVHFAGWYVGRVAPGDKGLSIIDGHVSGRQSDGIFKNLAKAKIGQEIVIEFGDKSIKKFSVMAIKIVPEKQAASALFSQDENVERQLNLITCIGKFNDKTQTYDDRVIVEAKFIE